MFSGGAGLEALRTPQGCVGAAQARTCGALGTDWAACLTSSVRSQAGLQALGGSAGCSVTLTPLRTETHVARRDV